MSKWEHLKYVERHKVGPDWVETFTGFADEAETKEYEQWQQDNWYGYFPRVLKVWEENGNWFLTLRTRESCD